MLAKSALTAIILMGACCRFATAEIRGKRVDYSAGTQMFQGYVAYDDTSDAPRPVVLVIHEWWGHNDYAEKRARDYAALGYLAFALDMYGKGVHAETAEAASNFSKAFYSDRSLFRQRAALGLAEALKDPRADHSRVAVLGYCFGGTAALELARSGADLRGTIVFHGGLSNPEPDSTKRIHGQVLAMIGADDSFISETERSEFKKQLSSAGVKFEYLEYPNAVHAFTNPEADSHHIKGIAYNSAADTSSFAKSRDFLAAIFQ